MAILFLHRGVEQLVARRAHNPKVEGSNPSPATKERSAYRGLFFVSRFRYAVRWARNTLILLTYRDEGSEPKAHAPKTQNPSPAANLKRYLDHEDLS